MNKLKCTPTSTRPVTGRNCTVIGLNSGCTHNNCVIIGQEITSDSDYQVKIGNSEVTVSRTMTKEEFNSIRDVLACILGT